MPQDGAQWNQTFKQQHQAGPNAPNKQAAKTSVLQQGNSTRDLAACSGLTALLHGEARLSLGKGWTEGTAVLLCMVPKMSITPTLTLPAD